ncbi:MAG: phage holin [Bacillota bacterium]|jgi:SPP1 family holin
MKTQTIARTAALILALLNQIFAIFGVEQLDIDNDTIYQIVSLLATVVTAARAWWKNNSFTKEAQYADSIMEDLKRNKREE